MLSIGTVVPERNIIGKRMKKDMSRACCIFFESVDTKTPIPMLVKRNIIEAKKKSGTLPLMGSPIIMAIMTLGKSENIAIDTVGRSFARITSCLLNGVTIICSIVPVSFSLTMVAAGWIIPTITLAITIIEIIMKNRNLSSGLYQILTLASTSGACVSTPLRAST